MELAETSGETAVCGSVSPQLWAVGSSESKRLVLEKPCVFRYETNPDQLKRLDQGGSQPENGLAQITGRERIVCSGEIPMDEESYEALNVYEGNVL